MVFDASGALKRDLHPWKANLLQFERRRGKNFNTTGFPK